MGKYPRKLSRRSKRRLSPEERMALQMLGSSPNGVTEELLVHVHGFTRRMLSGLALARL
jgi:hypothetical protein